MSSITEPRSVRRPHLYHVSAMAMGRAHAGAPVLVNTGDQCLRDHRVDRAVAGRGQGQCRMSRTRQQQRCAKPLGTVPWSSLKVDERPKQVDAQAE